ncbi:MAG: hypothetical protein E5X96_02005 [Mesorhizobium sp.]|nr:MAG: hypothetical protein E5X96_02005 [Mesorhizobium sp.]
MGVPAEGSALPYAAFHIPEGVTTPTMTPGAAVLGSADRTAASSFALSFEGSGVALAGTDPSAITFSMFATHRALSAANAYWEEKANRATEPMQRTIRRNPFSSIAILHI